MVIEIEVIHRKIREWKREIEAIRERFELVFGDEISYIKKHTKILTAIYLEPFLKIVLILFLFLPYLRLYQIDWLGILLFYFAYMSIYYINDYIDRSHDLLNNNVKATFAFSEEQLLLLAWVHLLAGFLLYKQNPIVGSIWLLLVFLNFVRSFVRNLKIRTFLLWLVQWAKAIAVAILASVPINLKTMLLVHIFATSYSLNYGKDKHLDVSRIFSFFIISSLIVIFTLPILTVLDRVWAAIALSIGFTWYFVGKYYNNAIRNIRGVN